MMSGQVRLAQFSILATIEWSRRRSWIPPCERAYTDGYMRVATMLKGYYHGVPYRRPSRSSCKWCLVRSGRQNQPHSLREGRYEKKDETCYSFNM